MAPKLDRRSARRGGCSPPRRIDIRACGWGLGRADQLPLVELTSAPVAEGCTALCLAVREVDTRTLALHVDTATIRMVSSRASKRRSGSSAGLERPRPCTPELPRERQRPGILWDSGPSTCRFRWWRGQDLNLRPSGYEPDELPDCSTPRRVVHDTGRCSPQQTDPPRIATDASGSASTMAFGSSGQRHRERPRSPTTVAIASSTPQSSSGPR